MLHMIVQLFAVADSGLWSVSDFRQWADRLILRLDNPAAWLLSVSMSASIEEVLDILRVTLQCDGAVLPDNFGDILIGLYYCRYRMGEISRGDLMRNVIETHDAYGGSVLDSEALLDVGRAHRGAPSALARLQEQMEKLSAVGEQLETYLRDPDLAKKAVAGTLPANTRVRILIHD